MGVTKRAALVASAEEPTGGLERVVRHPGLLERLQARETAAHAELYAQEGPAVLGHLRAMTGDAQLAEDLLQEVFVRVWTNVDRFRGASSLTTWLHGIALNLARSHRVKRARRRALRRQRAELAETAAVPSPEEELRELQARLRLYEAMERLPTAQREAFVLRVLEQRSLEDCQAVLGAAPTTISYRARRASETIRAEIEGDEA
jgi:RNA polymerase sigma-70 factor (ECF subfamily)